MRRTASSARVSRLSVSCDYDETKKLTVQKKKKNSPFKTQVILFLNLRHTKESGGVSMMLNFFFYVFKGK